MAAHTNGLHVSGPSDGPVRSLLDTDLYKLTMQQAVLAHYPDAQVCYKFTNRSIDMRFTRACVNKIRSCIDNFAALQLTQEEENWLATTCPYLKEGYRRQLRAFRFKPREEVNVAFVPGAESTDRSETGQLNITIKGKWSDVILYEVPVMAVVSEVYFTQMDTCWTMRGQRALARQKGRTLVHAGIRYSEFGTRRRRSYETHRLVIEGLLQGEQDALTAGSAASLGKLVGTSNVHLARLFGLAPVGTMAHEWTMAIAALGGYGRANLRALQLWDAVYSPPNFIPNSPAHDLTIALTDTFSTRVFWDDLLSSDEGRKLAHRWRGLRQDSGDSKAFARRAKEEYDALGIDASSKVVIYSDGLDVGRCLDLAAYSQQVGIGASFGVGTNLTNDFCCFDQAGNAAASIDVDDATWLEGADTSKGGKSNALNIVIKLHSINDRNAVKISDDLTKNTGDPDEVRACKRRFGIEIGSADNVEDA